MHCGKDLAEMLWKPITSVPGKARYEGFHISVIGRFGDWWQKSLFDIIKIILLMRFIPWRLKKIARFPIPNQVGWMNIAPSVYVMTYITSLMRFVRITLARGHMNPKFCTKVAPCTLRGGGVWLSWGWNKTYTRIVWRVGFLCPRRTKMKKNSSTGFLLKFYLPLWGWTDFQNKDSWN